MKNISPKEAIEVLKDMKIETPLPKAAVTQRKRNAAIEMAIDVLKYSELQNSSDLISRQVAIDKAIMIPVARIVPEDKVIWKKAVFVEDIEALPSAQPNLDEWCRDCKEYDKERHSCPRWNRVIRQTVEDLKAEQPERKKGEWICGEHDIAMCDGYWCDQCGFFVPLDYKHKSIDFIKDYHWCPSCGADMRGEEV